MTIEQKLDIVSRNYFETDVDMQGIKSTVRNVYCDGFRRGYEKAKPQWIPVDDRLPEKPEGYPNCEIRRTYFLVSLESGCVKSLGFEFDRNEWHDVGSPVVAWMPLPKPFEG